ncbi:MAG: hypothetical protein JWQ33_2997 [Ramlibacter sp.]|nr:hypothetical protein [Ramlibacter sp.]
MPFHTTVRRSPQFVQWRVSGPTSLENFASLIDAVAAETTRRGDTKVLVDLRAVEGELKFTEQFSVGEIVALKLAHLVKLASVVPAAQITRNSERVALRKGLQLRVFSVEAEAADWLSEPSGP